MERANTDLPNDKSWKQRATESVTSIYQGAKDYTSEHLLGTALTAAGAVGVVATIAGRGKIMEAAAQYLPDLTTVFEQKMQQNATGSLAGTFSYVGGSFGLKGSGKFLGATESRTTTYASGLDEAFAKIGSPRPLESLYESRLESAASLSLAARLDVHAIVDGASESAVTPGAVIDLNKTPGELLADKIPAANTLKDLQEIVAKPHLSGKTLDQITRTFGLGLETPAQHAIGELSENSQLKIELLESLKKQVAGHPNAEPATLNYLSKDKSLDIKYMLADHQSTDLETFGTLASDQNMRLRQFVGSREHAPLDVLAKLSRDAEPEVRAAVAGNESASPVILDGFTGDDHWLVQLNLAKNANASPAMLDHIASTGESGAKIAVTMHDGARAETIAKLARDEDWEVRAAAIENDKIPLSALATLKNDKEIGEYAQRRAADRFDILSTRSN